jgi:phenylacetate-CoA ligase
MSVRPFLRNQNTPFWNRHYETMPRERLDALHLHRIKSVLRHAYEGSKFYRRKLDEAGVHPDDIRSLDDFKRKVPLTDKSEFILLQEERPHYGDTLAVPQDHIAHHCETSGTTGVPLRIPYTSYDTERYGESWNYGFWAVGIRPSDTFYFAFNWGLFAGFWSAYWGVRRFGATVYSGGGQTSEGHIRLIQRLKPTVLMSTPTYALHLAEVARGMGVDPAGLSLKYTYHAGEPGPCAIPSMKRQLDKDWGATSSELLGVAEVHALAPGCPTREGVHVDETACFTWSRDPKTGQEAPEGTIGENILTTYVNNAQPLINYRTHDLVQRFNQCSCGRTWAYFRGVVLGRTDFMVTIRGTNVYQSAVENLVGQIQGVSNHFELLLTRVSGQDRMCVRAEPDPDCPAEKYSELERRIAETTREALHVRLEVEIVPPGTLPRYEIKTRRIIDQRPKEVRRALE